jgi:hypothetical protein
MIIVSLTEARELFARRYYVWCADQVRFEVESDFPILRSVRNATALSYLAHAASLPVKERQVFAQAMLKWRLRHILPGIGVEFSREEEGMARDFGESLTWAKPEVLRDYEEREQQNADFRIDKAKLWELIKARAPRTFPSGFRPFGRDVWRNEEMRGSWRVTTCVDLGGASRQLGYSHSLGISPEQPLWEPQISVLSWLGVTGQTDWNYYTASELPALTRTFYSVCERFVSATSALMHGLEST